MSTKMATGRSTFAKSTAEVEFCSNCGSIMSLPRLISSSTVINCTTCSQNITIGDYDGISSMTRVVFNSRELAKKAYHASKQTREEALGPVVDRKCWKCGFEKMSYATLQTRSADEGQTVFYTCIKCGAQDNENS